MDDVLLKDVAQVVDCEHKTAPRADGEDFFGYSVGTGSLTNGRIDYASAKPVSQATWAAWSKRAELRSGDLILAREAPVGQVGYVSGEHAVCLGQRTVLLRPDGEMIDGRYLHYRLLGPAAQEWMRTRSEGSTVVHLNVADVRVIPLPSLPSLSEQRAIAGVLSAMDDLIDSNQRLIANLDAAAMAAFRRAWDGVTTQPAGALGAWLMGQSPPGDTYNSAHDGPVFYQGTRDFGDRYPSPRVNCSAPSRVAELGGILLAVRAPIGVCNVATETTAIGRGLAALRASQPSTALRALTSELGTWAAHEGAGTVFSSISKRDILNASVPLVRSPDLEANLARLDAMHLALWQENAELRRTRDELLPLLMSGAVSVREVAVA